MDIPLHGNVTKDNEHKAAPGQLQAQTISSAWHCAQYKKRPGAFSFHNDQSETTERRKSAY